MNGGTTAGLDAVIRGVIGSSGTSDRVDFTRTKSLCVLILNFFRSLQDIQ